MTRATLTGNGSLELLANASRWTLGVAGAEAGAVPSDPERGRHD